MKFYLMTGLCGAGKTTFAKQFAKDHNCRYISIDNFYRAVYGNCSEHAHKQDVWNMCFQALQIAREDGVDVVLDTNSPRVCDRKTVLNRVAWAYDERYIIYVCADVEQCKKNNRNRERVIPEDEMEKIIKTYEPPTINELEDWTDIFTVRNINNNYLVF